MGMILSKQQTYELIHLSQQGNKQASEDLFMANTSLIYMVLQRYNRIKDEDLFQIGCIGLLKAINKFNTSYNVEFSTFAVPTIIGEIQRFVRDDSIVKTSRDLKYWHKKIIKENDIFYMLNGREMTIEEIVSKFDISIEKVRLARNLSKHIKSLDSPFSIGTGHDEEVTWLEIIEDKNCALNENYIALKDKIYQLPEKLKQIIIMRYYKDMTQKEVSDIFKVSQVQISRLEKQAIKLLKEAPNKELEPLRKRKPSIKINKKMQIFKALGEGWPKTKIMVEFQINENSYRNYVYEKKRKVGV
jgi:RNA polymerase sporulation-specific sigma factor